MPEARVTINLTTEALERIKAKADAKGLSVSALFLKGVGEKPLPIGRPWPKKENRSSASTLRRPAEPHE